jgi:hypothetical protein
MDDTDAYIVAICTCTLLLSGLLSQSVSVIHPGIRMHWIKEHWEPMYFKQAEKLISDLVSDMSQLPVQLIDAVALPSDGDIQDQDWSSQHCRPFIKHVGCSEDKPQIYQSGPPIPS